MSGSLLQLNTPCVGICSTVYGDDVCRGCKRTSTEVIDWNTLDPIKKQAIFDRLGLMITKVVEPFIIIHEQGLLRKQLETFHIRYREDQSAYCDVYYLLRAGASQIENSKDFGFSIHAPYKNTPLKELFSMIEEEYLTLAQRYFKNQLPQEATALKRQ